MRLPGSLVLCLGAMAGCGGSQCVVDTDCPNLFDICHAEQCVPRGAVDGGTDGGGTDGGGRDGSASDAGEPVPDGGLADAGS